jgi:hypothetical protein
MRGRPFEKGNRLGRGRPLGSRNQASLMVQQSLEEHAEAITKKCVILALKGDATALRLCMERLVGPRKQRVLRFKVPGSQTAAEVSAAVEVVLRGVSGGQLTPGEGQAFSQILEHRRKVIETEELEKRVRALEQGRLDS